MNNNLKPQDILVLLKLCVQNDPLWTYAELAHSLSMSASEVHQSIKRAHLARLITVQDNLKKPLRTALLEFLIHGVKYAYPPQRGSLVRGIPTAHAAPPLINLLTQGTDPPPVWPYPEGTTRGYKLTPLYKSVPKAALQDTQLYELLALIDALRDGRAREKQLAIQLLQERLNAWKTTT